MRMPITARVGVSRRHLPAMSLVSVLFIAGIGVPAGLFLSTHAIGERFLPYETASRLERLVRIPPSEAAQRYFSIAEFLRLRDAEAASRHFAFSRSTSAGELGAEAKELSVLYVSAGLLEGLGLTSVTGRTLHESDETRSIDQTVCLVSANLAAVDGESPWTILGRRVTLGDTTAEIVGVLPDTLQQPFDADVWLPLPRRADAFRQANFLTLLELRGTESPPGDPDQDPYIREPLAHLVLGPISSALSALKLVAVAAIVAVFVTSALMATIFSSLRRRDQFVALSLGASPSQATLLALAPLFIGASGGSLGATVVAVWTAELTSHHLGLPFTPSIPHWIFAASIAIGLAMVVIGCCLAATLRLNLHSLREERAVPVWIRYGFSALLGSVILVVSAAIPWVMEARRSASTDLGYSYSGAFYANVLFPPAVSDDFRASAIERALADGHHRVAVVLPLPMSMGPIQTQVSREDGTQFVLATRIVSRGYFAALGIPVISGEPFSEPVGVVLNASAANVLRSSIGDRFDSIRFGGLLFRVTAVVGDTVDNPLDWKQTPTMFLEPGFHPPARFSVIGQGSADVTRVRERLRSAGAVVGATAPYAPVVERWLLPKIMVGTLSTVFMATVLGAASSVSFAFSVLVCVIRKRDMAIRWVLGANSKRVLASILHELLGGPVFATLVVCVAAPLMPGLRGYLTATDTWAAVSIFLVSAFIGAAVGATAARGQLADFTKLLNNV